jgi:hypothetical protein
MILLPAVLLKFVRDVFKSRTYSKVYRIEFDVSRTLDPY